MFEGGPWDVLKHSKEKKLHWGTSMRGIYLNNLFIDLWFQQQWRKRTSQMYHAVGQRLCFVLFCFVFVFLYSAFLCNHWVPLKTAHWYSQVKRSKVFCAVKLMHRRVWIKFKFMNNMKSDQMIAQIHKLGLELFLLWGGKRKMKETFTSSL